MSAASVKRIVSLYESFTPADVRRLGEYYREDAWFKDPFNEVQGLPAIQRVFDHMFQTVDQPRFVITRQMEQGNECWLAWDFHFRFRSGHQVVRGASYLVLAEDGRVQSHRDYWDAAEELYEKLPVLGVLMRWLKRRIRG